MCYIWPKKKSQMRILRFIYNFILKHLLECPADKIPPPRITTHWYAFFYPLHLFINPNNGCDKAISSDFYFTGFSNSAGKNKCYPYLHFSDNKYIFLLGKNKFDLPGCPGSYCPKTWPEADKITNS